MCAASHPLRTGKSTLRYAEETVGRTYRASARPETLPSRNDRFALSIKPHNLTTIASVIRHNAPAKVTDIARSAPPVEAMRRHRGDFIRGYGSVATFVRRYGHAPVSARDDAGAIGPQYREHDSPLNRQ